MAKSKRSGDITYSPEEIHPGVLITATLDGYDGEGDLAFTLSGPSVSSRVDIYQSRQAQFYCQAVGSYELSFVDEDGVVASDSFDAS